MDLVVDYYNCCTYILTMKKCIFFFLLFIFTIPSFSQDVKIDLLDIYPAIIDKGSVKNKDGKIYLKVHKAVTESLRENPLAVVPDTIYAQDIMNSFSDRVALVADSLKDEIEANVMEYVQSQPDPENIDKDMLNKYILDYTLSLVRVVFVKNFSFSEEMISYMITAIFNSSKMETVSFNLSIDCDRNILEYKSIIFNFHDGSIEELQLTNEKRFINDSDPRGFAYRIFNRMCLLQD